MADQRLSVYSRKGILLDRLQATFTFSESLNEIGTAEFTMAISDPKCTERNLSFGNYILFEHARLGSWGGVIAPHNGQDWNSDDTITTRCLSAEYQFSRRRAPLHDLKSKIRGAIEGTEGQIMKCLIRYANMQEDTLLRPGRLFMGGPTRRTKLAYAMLNDLVAQILKRSELQFWVTPYKDGGELRFGVNLLEVRGRDRGYVMRERINMELPSGQHHRRDVEMINDALVLAEGGDAPLKPTGQWVNQVSVNKYGLWQGVDSVPGDNTAWAESRAKDIVWQSGMPKDKDKVIAIESEESPTTFANIGLGDLVTIKKDSVIFYGGKKSYSKKKQIVAREYDSDSKKCVLTMEGDE